MTIVANVVVGLVAALHVYFMILEMFLWDKPAGLKAFGQTLEKAQQSKVLAANQGLYNGFLAAGLVWGCCRVPKGSRSRPSSSPASSWRGSLARPRRARRSSSSRPCRRPWVWSCSGWPDPQDRLGRRRSVDREVDQLDRNGVLDQRDEAGADTADLGLDQVVHAVDLVDPTTVGHQ